MLPLTVQEELKLSWFTPDHVIGVFLGTSKYDAVVKKGPLHEGQPAEQILNDIPSAKEDCNKLKRCLQNDYMLSADNVYDLSNNPTEKEVEVTLRAVLERVKSGRKQKPQVKYLMMVLLAGHGLVKEAK